MRVLKFGGSSVADPARIREVRRIVLRAAEQDQTVVVVSALQNVTNQLLECARRAEAGDSAYLSLHGEIADRHLRVFKDLHGSRIGKGVLASVGRLLEELLQVLQGMYLLQYCSPRISDLTVSFGERLSATILSSYLRRSGPVVYVDARDFIITDDRFMCANVLFDATYKRARPYFERLWRSGRSVIPVVTGFIASTADGRTTTVGRNGSDYTASILAAALRANRLEIWTDVDGIMSADPEAVSSAFVLPEVSYQEAMELSYFGAKVIHPAAIAPAVTKKIPIAIKNTLNPAAAGTVVSERAGKQNGVAKGITSIENVTVLALRGTNMVGVPGTAGRLFHALARHEVNVILITQASSEHTICIAIRTLDAGAARQAIQQEFAYEFQNQLAALDEKGGQTIVAIVGDGMKGMPGVAGSVFGTLGRNHINITAIAQGASERNISFVISSAQRLRTLNVIHQAFFEKKKRLELFVIGTGNIGSALLRQLLRQEEYLSAAGYDLRVCGIADSKRYLLNPEGIDLGSWRSELDRSQKQMNLRKLAGEIARNDFTNGALVDCTASSAVVRSYREFVKSNLNIVTPNKKANVLPWREYSALMQLMKRRQKHFLYEANVGAGLPIISTIQDLIASGDTIVKIEGILSGTLSYLLNSYDGTRPFSALVEEAHQLGYTEPDPREDLSGKDVARKLLILARLLGLKMNLKNIRVENLVPADLRRLGSAGDFLRRYSAHDEIMKRRYEQARRRNAALRYVGILQGRAAFAGIREIPKGHPFCSTKGSDNMLAFTTQRYARTPLVIQGPGAGADVTAMGVFSDILKLLHRLPS